MSKVESRIDEACRSLGEVESKGSPIHVYTKEKKPFAQLDKTRKVLALRSNDGQFPPYNHTGSGAPLHNWIAIPIATAGDIDLAPLLAESHRLSLLKNGGKDERPKEA